jgi:hypothetical protein
MAKYLASMLVVGSLVVGAFAFQAVAETTSRWQTLGQRVRGLEASAERQRRAIESLRDENAQQQRQIRRLLGFRTDTNEQLTILTKRTRRLSARGVYSGPVDNGQVQLGADPAGCEGKVAEWNANGSALGCVPPAR